ncbi:MAG: hypothetical protein GTN70_08865 [Deltaproteobacteria bacterium]|nr:hypothetical protein [Deltaproteobacteria bacterium]
MMKKYGKNPIKYSICKKGPESRGYRSIGRHGSGMPWPEKLPAFSGKTRLKGRVRKKWIPLFKQPFNGG